MFDNRGELRHLEGKLGLTEGMRLVENIRKEEGDNPLKLRTGDLANFYLAAGAYQEITIAEKDSRYSNREGWDEMVTKAKYHLFPRLKETINIEGEKIAYVIAKTTVDEVLESHTATEDQWQHGMDHLNKELRWVGEEYREYCEGLGENEREEEGQKSKVGYYLPRPLEWKISVLEESMDKARESGDINQLKQSVGKFAEICGYIFDTEYEYGGWGSLVSHLGEWANEGEFDRRIACVDTLINSCHKRGSILEYVAVNPDNSRSFLDAKAAGNDWLAREAADFSLANAISLHRNLIPMERFQAPRE